MKNLIDRAFANPNSFQFDFVVAAKIARLYAGLISLQDEAEGGPTDKLFEHIEHLYLCGEQYNLEELAEYIEAKLGLPNVLTTPPAEWGSVAA